MPKTTLGKLPRDAIRLLDLPRIAPEILDGLRNLVDLTGTLSDACDELGMTMIFTGSRHFKH